VESFLTTPSEKGERLFGILRKGTRVRATNQGQHKRGRRALSFLDRERALITSCFRKGEEVRKLFERGDLGGILSGTKGGEKSVIGEDIHTQTGGRGR